jgi:DNA helicase II / ATP-dependent DNA helicase PcrA
MKLGLKETKADAEIRKCLEEQHSFYVIAGAGSGKTTSLITALDHIRDKYGKRLRRDVKHIVCVTYTRRAVAVISSRLGWDDLFVVSTLHSFLWAEIKRYAPDIRRALQEGVLPSHITKKKEDDSGGNSKKALDARVKVLDLERQLAGLKDVPTFSYNYSNFSDYVKGEMGHDDVIAVAAHMISTSEQLRRIIGQKYPYIFVDEAQDTHENIVAALNMVCENPGLPLVGYFGDPMQQIYDKRAGDFKGPPNSLRIPKEENFRSSRAIIDLLNAFRKDIQQFPAGKNAEVQGSVVLRLVQAEKPDAPRGRYTLEQTDRASKKLDQALDQWGWTDKADAKHLYLVRQMIARRLNFSNLHKLFTGDYASSRAQDEYESGEHFLLKPFIACLYPLTCASRAKNHRVTIDILRQNSPAFDPKGANATRTLADMVKRADSLVVELNQKWDSSSVGEVLRYCRENELCQIPKRLSENLYRPPRSEGYIEEVHSEEKGEWLADEYFNMKLIEIEQYCDFIAEKTPFSTQHGVKGEEYESVLVVFDDVGSAWNNYSFSGMLTPVTVGKAPTDRQQRLSENLAYVCFSRAQQDLRIVMFSTNAVAARNELLERKIFTDAQIEVCD